MHPEPRGGEERAFQVAAEDAWPDVVARNLAQRRGELVFGRGDERWLERRHAGGEQRLAGRRVCSRVRPREVDAAESVHVKVDEAGRRDPAAVSGKSDGRDPPLRDLDVAANELPVDDRALDPEPHVRIMRGQAVAAVA